MRLNIIGNGFDLYHGLPCSYYYFGCFLAEHYPDFYIEMSQMFGFACFRYLGFPADETEFVVDNLFWRTFEEKLGELDATWLEESLQDDLGLEYPDDPIELEIPEIANSQVIIEKFTEWIVKTINTSANYEIIGDKVKKLNFTDEDYFINFNYTQTLEEVYSISYSKVFHIHGECDLNAETDTVGLIVGHGNSEAINELEIEIEQKENSGYYLSSQGERNRLSELEAEVHILRDLRKNVASLLSDMKRNLQIREINPGEIWVWGLSCGEVDKPYIESLHEMYPSAKWMFSYYDLSEKKEREKLAKELGIANVEYFLFKNPDYKDILDEIVEQNNIVTYDVV